MAKKRHSTEVLGGGQLPQTAPLDPPLLEILAGMGSALFGETIV